MLYQRLSLMRAITKAAGDVDDGEVVAPRSFGHRVLS
jgi:hypothetical protein